jgi:hypothetical protein
MNQKSGEEFRPETCSERFLWGRSGDSGMEYKTHRIKRERKCKGGKGVVRPWRAQPAEKIDIWIFRQNLTVLKCL